MVKSKEETAYLLQTCGDNFVIREFRADVKYDMVAYTKPVITGESCDDMYLIKTLTKKNFTGVIIMGQKRTDGSMGH